MLVSSTASPINWVFHLAKNRKSCLQCFDTSNKPLEWTGHHQQSAAPPQAPCLPLRGSVRRIVPPLSECRAELLPARSHGATLSVWFQFAVQRSLHVGSGAFGTSGPKRSFRPGLNASSAAIQAMFGPLGQESLSCGFTMALVTGSIFNSGDRCWSFFSPVVTRAPRQKIFNLRRISLVTSRRINDGDEDGTL